MGFAEDKQKARYGSLRTIIANGDSGVFDATAHYSLCELLAMWARSELPDGTPITPMD